MTIYFISDLHLTPTRPNTNLLFREFLNSIENDADALYILGDLFEFWIGDDAAERIGQSPVLSDLKAATESGIRTYFMRGNRDFLVGEEFASATGCEILTEPTVIELDQTRVLLLHGDNLCTDDVEHQRFRTLVNDPQWQRTFLRYPIEKRIELAVNARSQSNLHKSMTSMEIMDVNSRAVSKELELHDVDILIHGHTHRPAVHTVKIGKNEKKRIVLGDWYEQSSVMRYSNGEFHLRANNVDYPCVREIN